MSKNNHDGFALVDSIIGLTIISLFSIFYIGITRQMNRQIDNHQQTMMTERNRYEDQLHQK